MKRPVTPNVVALAIVTAVSPLTYTIFPPMLEVAARDLGTPLSVLQYGLSLYLFVFAAAQPLYGPLSDRMGRRAPLLTGLAIYTLASLACALAPDAGLLNLARAVQAVGVCAGLVIARAVVRDAFGARAPTVLAYIIGAMAIGPAIGSIAGGLLGDWLGWRIVFWILAGYGVIIYAVAWWAIPEPASRQGAGASWGSIFTQYGRLLVNGRFLLFALCGACHYATFYAFLTGAPYVMGTLGGLTPSAYALWFALFPITFCIFGLTGGFLSKRFDHRFLIMLGNWLSVVIGVAMIAVWHSPVPETVMLVAAMILLSAVQGLMLALTIGVAVGLNPRIAGSASGLIGFIHMGSSAAAVAGVGALDDGTSWPVTIVVAVLAILPPFLWLAGEKFRPPAG